MNLVYLAVLNLTNHYYLMKNYFLLMVSLIAFLVVSCTSEPEIELISQDKLSKTDYAVTLEDAKIDLMEILSQLNYHSSRAYEAPRYIENAYTTTIANSSSRSEGCSYIHVFNFANNKGFAIMSADKRLPSLLAIVEDGSYEDIAASDNPGPKMFIDKVEWTLKRHIDEDPFSGGGGGGNGSGGSTGPKTVYSEWQTTVFRRDRQCKVTWHQGDNYNYYCPRDPETGELSCAGCVPVALAQLMTIFKYPPSYNGHVFHWDEMTAYPHGEMCSLSAYVEIAQLIALLGLPANLNVDYHANGSGSYIENIPRTMEHLGYMGTGRICTYNTDSIVDELTLGYPVILSALPSKVATRGHAWLASGAMLRQRDKIELDGNDKVTSRTTEKEWYILCNWGWDKSQLNGFYLSEAFNVRKGPSFDCDGDSTSSDIYGTGNYIHELRAVIDIYN